MTALNESSEFLFKGLHDVKANVTTMKTSVTAHMERLLELAAKVNEAERLYALKEQEGENLKCVMEICRAIAPDLGDYLQLHINVTHRIGQREDMFTDH